MNQSERAANGVKRSAGYAWCYADRSVQVVVAGIIGCVLSGPTFAQESPDAMSVLKAAAATYSAATKYHFVTVTTLTPPDGASPHSLRQLFAGGPGGAFRQELDWPSGRVIHVSNGTAEWTYFPDAGQYMQKPSGSGLMPNLGADALDSLAAIDRHLVRSADWLRAEPIDLEGQSLVCDVVKVDLGPGMPLVEDPEADRLWRAEWTGVPKTYWIDRTAHRVLRSEAVSKKGAQQVTLYSVARLGDDVSDDLFRFPIPDGAVEVQWPAEGLPE